MFYFEPLAPADVSARALVLSLISGAEAGPQSIARLIDAAALFGIEAPALRVAVTRLIKEGLLESPDRGLYMPGPRARALTRRLQDWQNVRSKLAPWKGDWLIALTHHLGRSDRKQLRARERALSLTGFRETTTAIWVRPANLAASLADSFCSQKRFIVFAASGTSFLRARCLPILAGTFCWNSMCSAGRAASQV